MENFLVCIDENPAFDYQKNSLFVEVVGLLWAQKQALQRTKYTQAIPKQLNSAAIACRACAAECGTSPTQTKANSTYMTFWQNILTTSAPISAHQTEVAHSNQRVNNKKPPNSTLRGVNMTQARVLTERELRKVLAHCAQQPHANRNRAMLLCTHLAGMRIGEVAALRVSDVLNG